MVVWKGMEGFAGVRVPDFAGIQSFVSQSFGLWEDKGTDAVKSALPVTALEVSGESFELHTAPLWPGM